jgi:predicted nuclease with TOPRIM domain
MVDIQEVYNRLQETKKKQKDVRSTLRDALSTSAEYQELLEKIKAMRTKKQQMEAAIKSDFSGEMDKMEEYALDMKSDNMLLSDAAMTKLMKGETVELTDEYNNKFEPIFSVRFKKVV